jgi:hypothetical protein
MHEYEVIIDGVWIGILIYQIFTVFTISNYK